MKLKTRLVIAFMTIIILPVFLTSAVFCGFAQLQIRSIEKTYGITGTTYEALLNSVQVPSRITKEAYHELERAADKDPEKLEDASYLEQFNQRLRQKGSYLLVRKDDIIVYMGEDPQKTEVVIPDLPAYEEYNADSENGVYIGGEAQVLVKQVDFVSDDKNKCSAFIVTDVTSMLPEVSQFLKDILVAVIVILVITGALLVVWIYRGIKIPLVKMQKATKNIKEGNLDFRLIPDTDDELGQLCQDFEEMRIRLKENAEEKIQYDIENKELISNISHDLKTPITAIKGYVEGIMDGVASSPEKLDKYIRTIYNKANDMDRLIDELTFYSKIDTNKIPYEFNKINVNSYFGDCVEEVGLDMDSRNIELGYFNYVSDDVVVIADAEQMKRVINNIISNSLKYMDKPKGIINIRIKDVGDFIQIEIEDNGRGIAAKDLPCIFDRFYRTDSSRNSSQGGSGIGLSIVRKIVEDHGGRIWATSKEGMGTEMHIVLRKYQEVLQSE